MAEEIPSTPADGNFLALIVPAIADTAAPKLTELNAAGVVDISCYLTAGGWKPSLSEQVITDDRLCSTQTFEKKGRSQRSLEVEYIDNTNSPNAEDFNKAKDTLVPGSKHFLVTRSGMPFDAAKAVGQKFSVRPIEAGEYNDMPPEANSVLKTGQKLFINGKTQTDVAAVA
ncbi:hypothetical protein ACIPY0_20210 [Paenarthrobacter nicotinovorans]|uniref:phage tail tube protein n=1 Tax=Paenarthrobacter nicotinovorans TaxID=29320 RepID=UPI0037F71E37